MQRIRIPCLVLAAILALSACHTATETDAMALAIEPEDKIEGLAADAARPWKGWYDWVVTSIEWASESDPDGSTFDGRCDKLSVYIVHSVGQGQLGHMGRIGYSNDHCAHADYSYDGVMTFEAADGSRVETTYSGAATPNVEAGGFVISSDFTIVGGTGRFAGASGGGPGGAWLPFADQNALFSGQASLREWIDGSIVYGPGKSRGR